MFIRELGVGLESEFVFKGKLFLLKKPIGLFRLDDEDPDPANWLINRINDEFGAGSPHSVVQILDDVLVSNNYGSVTSIGAVQAFGDVKAADIYRALNIEQFMRENASNSTDKVWSLFDKQKKQVYFTRQTRDSATNNRLLILDLNLQNPRAQFSDKDTPNCLVFASEMLRAYSAQYTDLKTALFILWIKRQGGLMRPRPLVWRLSWPTLISAFLIQTLGQRLRSLISLKWCLGKRALMT